MTSIAVIVHVRPKYEELPRTLRAAFESAGVTEPMWFEVRKSKQAPKLVKRAVKDGADLVFAAGGDGLVQRCADVLAGSTASLAIVPTGTANLLATNLELPKDLAAAIQTGLHGGRRSLDVGVANGERFVVMSGAGFDARMIRDTTNELKQRFGRLSYVWSGARHVFDQRFRARIKVDGRRWFKGKASCVLVGNVGRAFAGLSLFDDARPDDGVLQIGVLRAKGLMRLARAMLRITTGHARRSPFLTFTSGRSFDIKLDRKVPYELDGGERPSTRRLRIAIDPGALTVCVPDRAAMT